MRSSFRSASAQRGMSVFGTLTFIAVAALVCSFVVTGAMEWIHKERLERCLTEISDIQATLWPLWAEGTPPDPEHFWNDYWAGQKPGPYQYIPNEDVATTGYTYELLGCDRTRTTGPPCRDFRLVIVCTHDHGRRARYVYVRDGDPPSLATEGNDPRYDEFVDKDDRSDLAGRGSL